MSNTVAVPFFFNPELDPDFNKSAQRGLAYPMFLSFASQATQRFSRNLADIGLDAVQGLYVDNSTSPAPTTIVISGTLQTIVVPPFTQGYYRPLVQNQQLDFSVTNYATQNGSTLAANTIGLHWLSILPDTSMVWSVQVDPGTQFMTSSTGANAYTQCYQATPTGRIVYVSGFSVTGGGATVGSLQNIMLENILNAGIMNFTVAVPTGATTAMQPLIVAFSPPLLTVSGGPLLAVPAFGAGNTAVTANLWGYIV